jgi:hypothetical protein
MVAAKENLNLILSFQLAGDTNRRTRGAARITIGHGSLTVYETGDGVPERIDLADVESLSIQSVNSLRKVDGICRSRKAASGTFFAGIVQ